MKKSILLLLAGSLLFSCFGNRGIPEEAGDILFRVMESHLYNEDQEPQIYLFLQTSEEYGCCNYKIENRISYNNNQINIEILGVSLPGDICLTAIGPATAQIPLNLGNGEYEFEIKNGEITDTYNITVNTTAITLNGESSSSSQPVLRKFLRFPERSFAFLFGSLPEDSLLCERFIDTLNHVLDLNEYTFPQDGFVPYPDSSYGHYWDTPAIYYIYETESDYDHIETILRSFISDHMLNKSGIGISTCNWMGQWHRSWVIENDL